MHLLQYYFLAINFVAFILFGIDKLKARKNLWRIPETTLLLLAVIGGSIGAWMGMYVWHHKTMHLKFKYGVPVILALQIAIGVYILTYSDLGPSPALRASSPQGARRKLHFIAYEDSLKGLLLNSPSPLGERVSVGRVRGCW